MAQNARRICLTGPECTGKTMLAQRLAREFEGDWIPEFAREYALRVARELTAEDVEPIARGQMALETSHHPGRRLAQGDEPERELLILDTDLVSTVVYARHYYGACPAWIEDAAREHRADLYLLFDTDVEWLPDPARDASCDAREDLFDAFRAALDEFETTWTIVSGGWEERAAQAREAVRGLGFPAGLP